MFEIAVWLVVTLYSPDAPRGKTIFEGEYVITDLTDLDAADDRCEADARLWRKKALTTKRGTWMLDVACQVRHDEAEPANGHP